MRQKLEKLRDRLSDLSKRNRSLRLLKIYDKWNFDLAQLDNIEEAKHSTTEQVLKKILSGAGSIFLVSNQSSEETAMRASHKLNTLHRNVNAIEEETGMHNLYVGYPFLTGRMSDGTFVQAPLFLFPVRLEKKNQGNVGWVLTTEAREDAIINRTFILAFQKYNQVKINEQIFEDAKDLPHENFRNQICELLNTYGIPCTLDEADVTNLPQYRQNEIPNLAIGQFIVKRHLVLGHFPQGNSALLKDYESLMQCIDGNEELGLLGDLLNIDDEINQEGQWDSSFDIDIDGVSSKERNYITELDASQEAVLSAVEINKGLVVHGPPGTGKSQVIVNLVAKAVANNLKVLVVCQKRAALDVVYQRLGMKQLADQVALVHDPAVDRKALYKKISNVMDEQYVNAVSIDKEEYQTLSTEIDKKTNYFNNLSKFLWSRQGCGLSPFQLYSRSKMLSETDILLNLNDLSDKIDANRLKELATLMKRLGKYFGLYGHEGYSLINRKSFAGMGNANLYELRQQIVDAMSQSTEILAIKSSGYTGNMNPKECWQYSKAIEKGVRKIAGYNQKKFLSNLSLWFWTRFSGKQIVERLSPSNIRGFGTEDWKQFEKGIMTAQQYGINTRTLVETLNGLKSHFEDKFIESLLDAVSTGDIPSEMLNQIKCDLENDFNELLTMDGMLANLDEIESRVLQILLNQMPPTPNPDLGTLWREVLEKSFYIKWIDKAEFTCPEIKGISTGRYGEMLDEYKRLIIQKRNLSPKYLKTILSSNIRGVANAKPKKFKELKHQVGKMRQVWSVRKLVGEFSGEGLLDIIPVWLVSPESVSAIFPMIPKLFDWVIFDEASQCPVENGLPSFYRAGKVIIAGDEKQLPPSDIFKVSSGSSDEEDDYSDETEDSDSLLMLSKRSYPTKLLAWHYRSNHEELINFSNHAFYDGKMEIAPNITPFKEPPAIEWVAADGIWDNQCNEVEAGKVCESLREILKVHQDKTVGIITFNKKQQDLLMDRIERMAAEDMEFGGLYSNVMSRDMDERLFVKNIENVQGDERDIIIFSIGYGKNLEGRVSVNFGTLNRQGGENRLNVAISRAKEKVFVVCSVLPIDFNVDESKNLGPYLFKKYLEYAHAISNNDHISALAVLREVNPSLAVQSVSEQLTFDSPFEEEVYAQLKSRGYEIRTQVGCSGYRIDMAVANPQEPSRFVLGIECDGAMFHSAKSARERDIYRQRFLEGKGWNIARIWSRNWWHNPAREIARIEEIIQDNIQSN